MRGSRRSGSRACAFWKTTRPGTGKKAAITCGAIPGQPEMANGFAGPDPNDSRFTIPDLRFPIYDLRFTIYDLRFTIHDSRFTVLTTTSPKDAAAVILLAPNSNPTNPEVFLVRRSEKLAFLGGYHAFPGGQFDVEDAETPVDNCDDPRTRAAISAAARELFEEL